MALSWPRSSDYVFILIFIPSILWLAASKESSHRLTSWDLVSGGILWRSKDEALIPLCCELLFHVDQQIQVDHQIREGKKVLEEREKTMTHVWHVFPTVKNEREMRKTILDSVI
uniref:Uncharacterized protein n=1 Tax=Populus alba TaxID=43335 RepID=A0A4U5QWQ6_POPAL|nr:hypothetical protein D5086_0000032650 [Populus alba]